MSSTSAFFFMGQGGEVTSSGMLRMQQQAHANGINATMFRYQDLTMGLSAVATESVRKSKIALIGYSLGVGTIGYISQKVACDLVIGLDPSRDGINYRLGAGTVRSILYHNQNWLSRLTGIGGAGEASDPGGELGFQIKHEINENHLLVDADPQIQAAVLAELIKLKG